VLTTPETIGPVVAEQETTLAVPEILQAIVPLGATALVVPVTVAVKIVEPPREGVVVETRVDVAVAFATAVVEDEAVAETELYDVSPE